MTADQMRAVVAEQAARVAQLSPTLLRIQIANTVYFVRNALPVAEVRVRGDGTLVFALGDHAHEWPQ